MLGILDKMVSGDTTPSSSSTLGDSSIVSEAVNAVIEDSRVPLGVIIESVQNDTDNGILLALEAFELESCIGAAQVITEGTNPMVVMEGAVKNFFRSIGERIRQFWEWIKGIFAKIFKKSKDAKEDKKLEEASDILSGKTKAADGSTYDEKVKEIASDGNGGEVLGDGSLYLFNVKDATDMALGIIEASETLIGDCGKDVTNIQKEFIAAIKNLDKNKFHDDARTLGEKEDRFNPLAARDNDAAEVSVEKDICTQIGNKVHVKANNRGDLIKSIDASFGRGENAKPVEDISKLNGSSLIRVVNELKQGQYESYARELLKEFERNLNTMKDAVNEMDKEAMHIYNNNGTQPRGVSVVVSKVSESMRRLNVLGSITTSVLNRIINLLASATATYNAFAKKVLAYKKSKVQGESIDYSVYMESKDVDEEGAPDDDNDKAPAEEGCGSTKSNVSNALESYIGSYIGL